MRRWLRLLARTSGMAAALVVGAVAAAALSVAAVIALLAACLLAFCIWLFDDAWEGWQ